MPVWTLASLLKFERQALPAIRKGLRQGLSASEALESFRAGGGRIANERWFTAYREMRGVVTQGQRAVTPRRRLMPDYAALPESPTKLNRRYSFEVELRGVAPREEEDEGYFVTVSTSRQLSYAEIAEAALAFVGYIPGESVTDEIRPIIHRGVQAGRAGTRM